MHVQRVSWRNMLLNRLGMFYNYPNVLYIDISCNISVILTCFRTCSDNSDNIENKEENDERCDCHTCNETTISCMVKKCFIQFNYYIIDIFPFL
jgi:hypothetical protein